MRLYRLITTVVLLVLAAGVPRTLFAQGLITTNDTTVCPNTTVTLNASGANSTGITTDDFHSGVIPLGFTFNFYGTAYTQCVVSGNGYIDFDLGQANTFSQWNINSVGIPGNTNVRNAICGFYSDILPGTGPTDGQILYSTVGQAPFRKFVVYFCNVRMFSCTNLRTTFQMVLFETTNDIEVHLAAANAGSCLNWNLGQGIEGVCNSTGTAFTVVPGRNATVWNATNSSHRFTPTTPANTSAYTVGVIPYSLITIVPTSTLQWLQNGVTQIAVGPTVNVTPAVTTFYVAKGFSQCAQDTVRDTVTVTIAPAIHIDSIRKTDPSTCGQQGSIRLYGLLPNTQYVLKYDFNGAPVSINITSSPTGVISIIGFSGTYTNFVVYRLNCYSNTVGPIILTDPPLTANYNFDIYWGCESDSVKFTNTSVTSGVMFYKWSFGDGAGDTAFSPGHTYQIQNSYSVKLVSSNGVCRDSVVKVIDLNHPLVAAFTTDRDSICQNGDVVFTNTSTTTTKNGINPSYQWVFGDGGTSTAQNPTYSYTRTGVYTVRMIVTDFVPCSDTAYKTIVVDSTPYIRFTVSDDTICAGQGVVFTADFLPIGYTGLTWTFGDGTTILDKNPLVHSYDTSGSFIVTATAAYRLCADTIARDTLEIRSFPALNLGPDTALCVGGAPIRIGDYSAPAGRFLWNTGDTTATILARNYGTYYATISSEGCAATDTVEIRKDCYLDIPNVFTPDGDGLNDYFLPRVFLSRSLTKFRMTVFNRWGQMIFETTNINGRGWDGKFNDLIQPQGVYVYRIDAEFENDKKESYTGNVTLLR